MVPDGMASTKRGQAPKALSQRVTKDKPLLGQHIATSTFDNARRPVGMQLFCAREAYHDETARLACMQALQAAVKNT